jgi:hypothetical protein
MEKEFSKLCTPAKIYFVLAIIASIFALFSGMGIVSVIVKLIFAFIWTFILSWLCEKGYKSLSWFLVLLPYVVILLVLIGLTKSSYMSYTNMLYPGYSPSYGSGNSYNYGPMNPMNGASMMMPMTGYGMMKEGMKGGRPKQY